MPTELLYECSVCVKLNEPLEVRSDEGSIGLAVGYYQTFRVRAKSCSDALENIASILDDGFVDKSDTVCDVLHESSEAGGDKVERIGGRVFFPLTHDHSGMEYEVLREIGSAGAIGVEGSNDRWPR
jgi:hypothetical protein